MRQRLRQVSRIKGLDEEKGRDESDQVKDRDESIEDEGRVEFDRVEG